MELSQIQQYAGGRAADTDLTTDALRTRYAALRARAADSEEAAAETRPVSGRRTGASLL
ncbi:hypothetical protein [Halolamina salifodinae]|uniref:Uncharacterized protein n=1 Tax=Halolamina salifodinae TaxID=1202767 RepID=A0A8T4GW16_9EURY|nr:hypothetical protein [Halolamina salifodinae]MBP1985884.1 hypothetical protein [Halolamina salifodinae]